MKRSQTSALIAAGTLFAACGFILSCAAASTAAVARPDPRRVSAVTGGTIPRDAPIRVEFVDAIATAAPPAPDAFRLEPRVPATIAWEGERTLVLTPKEPLPAGTRFTAIVHPEKLQKGSGPGFSFLFETDIPTLDVSFDPVRADENGRLLIAGRVLTDADVPASKVERVLRASGAGRAAWNHGGGVHRFSFPPVERASTERNVTLAWNGGAIGTDVRGTRTVRVPAAGSFEVIEIRPLPENAAGLEVTFSQPLKAGQDLRGFVSLSGTDKARYSVDGNVARVYGAEGLAPGTELRIRDLTDAAGTPLMVPVAYQTGDVWELPEIRFAGGGVILPRSQGASLVLETRNVSGVIVEAFEIHGDNMIQFLQVNNLDGQRELRRVGEPVWTKAFDLPWGAADKNRWVRHGLDLSALANARPDGMFRIRVTFRKRHVRYECPAGHPDFSDLPFPADELPEYEGASDESSYWDYYEDDYEGRQNRWRYRKDPCHPAFYEPVGDHDITIGRNVLVSDLGVLAKATPDGEWLIVANDLKTTKAVPGASFSLLNYQGRVLTAGTVGADGMATVKTSAQPSFLVASGASGKAFLKLDTGLALATSHFDVSGDKPVGGVKGFIYGERGVWRPGDPIYLTFLLSDSRDTLPEDHPVTFELEDPRGRIAATATYTSSIDGFYPIKTGTAVDAPTGDWTARVRVGGSVFTKSLKIETVMPNRLKMTLSSGTKPYLDSSLTPFTLSAAWLHGAPAPDLAADVSVVFADAGTAFSTYKDHIFRDPSRSVSAERQILFDGNLDASSRARFDVELSPGEAVPGKLKALLTTRVFEPTGVFSSEQIAMDFSPYERYVGIKLPKGDAARNMLLTDTDHAVDIVVLDGEGKPSKDRLRLECVVYKLEWRWWWEKGGDEAAEFAEAQSRTPVARGEATAANGKALWNFRVKYPDWGRYLVSVRDPSGGHAAASIVYIDWPGWAGRSSGDGQGAAAMLALTTGKPTYAPGETIRVDFPSNDKASALVVVEKGGQIIRRERVACSKDSTRYEFPATAAMAPNVYVHVALFQEHLQTANDLPIRLYGIVPIAIDDPATRLEPIIASADAWEPMSQASFTVREAKGRPMTYTAVVVDEGLLGLTRFSIPNPRDSFYRKEASFLKSWDLYAAVMGAYSGKLETLLAIGGGDDGFGGGERKAVRFKPVVQFFGPYRLGAGETRTERFDIPQYVGALRVMIVAGKPSAGGGAYGVAERSVPVKGDLMVLGTLPRVLSPDDELTIPVSVFSYQSGAKNVTVRCEVSGAAALASAPTTSVYFDASGDKTVDFKAKAAASPGIARFKITAEANGAKNAIHEIELEVRSTAIPVTRAFTKLLNGGDAWNERLTLPGRGGTNDLVLELSRIPPLGLEARAGGLIAYPHGCVEQTTSSVFPQLYLDRVMELDPKRLAEVRLNVAAGIERLASFQTSEGGFAYWPGGQKADDWGSSYAGHFLTEARRAGYPVPAPLLDGWIAYQRAKASAWSSGEDYRILDQAYRLYTLALAGAADLGSMNRLKERSELPVTASWRLAAAYWHAGQRDTARSMIRGLPLSVGKYRELSYTYGSDFRDKAMILETLVLTEDSARSGPLLIEVAQTLASDRWLSTQETAYALIAVLPLAQATAEKSPIQLDTVFQNEARSITFRSPLASVDLMKAGPANAEFRAVNRSKQPVYVRLVAKGLPAEGAEPAVADGLGLDVQYRTLDGATIDPASLTPGADMEIAVTVTNRRSADLNEIALVHALPASWELMNYRLSKVAEEGEGEEEGASDPFDYQDIRDDRIMTYFDLRTNESKTVTFRVNRTYGGSFFIPAVHAYAMYDESIRALVPGRRIGDQPALTPTENIRRTRNLRSLSQ